MPIHIVYLLFPTGSVSRTIRRTYIPFPCRSWDYPTYARNPLDASPNAPIAVRYLNEPAQADEAEVAIYPIVGEQTRLRTSRLLVVYEYGRWRVVPGADHANQPYIFVSYTTIHFNTRIIEQLEEFKTLAQRMAREAGVNAYWLDCECRANTQPDLSDDVHGIYDVVRGARQVCVMFRDLSLITFREWGQRMWTLPEALLSQHQYIKFCSLNETEERTKLFLAAEVWTDRICTRLLAEHFTGVLNLSRLELITVALEALATRYTQDPSHNNFTQGDIAYALMALLAHRLRMNPEDTLFQALARLSLANDSDRIVERMICMLPDFDNSCHDSFVFYDRLGANLWDIEPLCQVAGVCNDREVILDGCRGISIYWKDIPQIVYYRRWAWKRFFAKMAVRSASLWFIIGAAVATFNTQVGVPILFLGVVLLIYSPWGICTIYGGKIWDQFSWLIGFEGVLSIEEIERKAFGNSIGRLSYAPSSNMFSGKERDERVGIDPAWVGNPFKSGPVLPEGHRFFTLIDTGSMTVSIFSAEKPLSVALVCGREGGMLRVVLCSYERSTNCLYMESVLRMETPMLDKACLLGWIKVAGSGVVERMGRARGGGEAAGGSVRSHNQRQRRARSRAAVIDSGERARSNGEPANRLRRRPSQLQRQAGSNAAITDGRERARSNGEPANRSGRRHDS
jgi:hypothetical protein